MGTLTVRSVAALKEPGRYSDGDGLHLRILADGRRYWVLRVQIDGRRRDINIGRADRIGLAAARELSRKERDQLKAGGKVERRRDMTFARAAVEVHTARTKGWKGGATATHARNWLTTLETYAVPVIGDLSLADIERHHIIQILAPIWIDKEETARRVMQRLDAVMRWAVASGYRRDRIDMAVIRDGLPRQRKAVRHMAAVSADDIPDFYRAINDSPSAPAIRYALRWMALTIPRPGNVVRATWEQIDMAAAVWSIPGEQMKMSRPHTIPLSAPALELLDTIRPIDASGLIFTAWGDQMSPDTMRMAMRRMGRSETPHGLRSSFKEWSLSAGYPDYLSEKALAHVDKDKVRAAYARSDLLEERRPMMDAWAKFVTSAG